MYLETSGKYTLVLEYNDGGSTIVFPANLNIEEADPFRRIQSASPHIDSILSLEEENFASLLVVFLEKYIDRVLIPLYCDWGMTDSDDPVYDYYGNNLYTYADVNRMIDEIKSTADAIRNGQATIVTDELKSHINPRVFPNTGLNTTGEEVLVMYKEEIADYYERFCEMVQSVMKNTPEYEYLDFCGP